MEVCYTYFNPKTRRDEAKQKRTTLAFSASELCSYPLGQVLYFTILWVTGTLSLEYATNINEKRDVINHLLEDLRWHPLQ